MRLESNNDFIGVDIGDRMLRLVRLKKSGKKFIVTTANEIQMPEGILKAGEIFDEKILTDLIKKLVKTARGSKIATKNVISVLPEQKTFIKVMAIDLGSESYDKKKIPDLIKKELINHIPLSLEELYLDWQVLSHTKTSAIVLVGAVTRVISDNYRIALEHAGLIPYILEVEAAPIIRTIIEEKDNSPKIVIDFGASRTGLIVYDHHTVQFTVSLPLSGDQITKTIAQILNIDLTKAEEAKVICGLDTEKCEGALRKVLFDAIDNLAEHIEKTISFYQDQSSNARPFSKVILVGGGANFLKINEVLQEKLNLPVEIGNPLLKSIIVKKDILPKNKLLSYATAIGLALRTFEQDKNL